MTEKKSPDRSPLMWIALAAIGVLCSFVVPGREGPRLRELAARGRVVRAIVMEARGPFGKHRKYQLRYRFQVPGKLDWYYLPAASELFNPLTYVEMPKPEWQRAKDSGFIDVLYLPDQPQMNHPAELVRRISP